MYVDSFRESWSVFTCYSRNLSEVTWYNLYILLLACFSSLLIYFSKLIFKVCYFFFSVFFSYFFIRCISLYTNTMFFLFYSISLQRYVFRGSNFQLNRFNNYLPIIYCSIHLWLFIDAPRVLCGSFIFLYISPIDILLSSHCSLSFQEGQ